MLHLTNANFLLVLGVLGIAININIIIILLLLLLLLLLFNTYNRFKNNIIKHAGSDLLQEGVHGPLARQVERRARLVQDRQPGVCGWVGVGVWLCVCACVCACVWVGVGGWVWVRACVRACVSGCVVGWWRERGGNRWGRRVSE